ncbi:MAG: hypothetical protein ACLSAF_08615 [Intestinimonas sp.]
MDTLALLNETMDGPVVVGESGWREKIPFDFSRASVNRAGKITSADALVQNDVVYWSKSMNTLWAYTNRVTGTLQAVSPPRPRPPSPWPEELLHRDLRRRFTPSAIWAPSGWETPSPSCWVGTAKWSPCSPPPRPPAPSAAW